MQQRHRLQYYLGLRNPSGAVAFDSHTFIVADDEQNVLQVFDQAITRYPRQQIKLSELFPGQVSDAAQQELDLEGATNLHDTFFWIGSHSANRHAEFRPARHCLFALTFTVQGNGYLQTHVVGSPYQQLIHDLAQDPRFAQFDLLQANSFAPKEPGGLSIEGLAATPEGTLLIGFRNPLQGGKIKRDQYCHGKALLVELLNPLELMIGADARFGDPLSIDLDGNGIRDMTWLQGQKYLVVAGPYDSKIDAKLYSWSRKSGKAKQLVDDAIVGLNLEAAIIYPGAKQQVQLLSDDGKLLEGRGFRSIEVDLEDV